MQRDNLSFYESSEGGAPVSIVSIPLELGSDVRGLSKAPARLLECGLREAVRSAGREVVQEKKIAVASARRVVSAGSMKHGNEIAVVAHETFGVVERMVRRGETVIALGGDHSSAIGSIAGAAAAYPKLGVIWIDAHPDCNTDRTTITGNVHGMVASTLMGYGAPLLTSVVARAIAPRDFLFVGLKDMDQAEIGFLRENRCECYTMLDIARRGPAPVFAAIEELSKRVDKIWISMDMDSIDETFASGVGMPNAGGLTRREVAAFSQFIGKTCDVAGFDIVEFLPERDIEGKTAGLALELAARLLGGANDWYASYIRQYRETNVTEQTLTRGREQAA